MKQYQPPLTLTPTILSLVAEIGERIGRWSASNEGALSPQLRRGNRIRTIQASLAIENNTLSLEQVTAVLEGKRVLGLPHEIQEVRNAFAAYECLNDWKPGSRRDLLAAHKILMAGLIDTAGAFRSGGVGIYRGKTLLHMAPPAKRVAKLLDDLLAWSKKTDLHPLILSCVFHYEFEFIHPFADGNGRMGRLWQTLILSQWKPVMAYLPVETVIRKQQAAYYKALANSDQAADAKPFVEFMLKALLTAMDEVVLPDKTASGKTSGKTSGKIIAAIRANRDITIPGLAAIIGISERSIERNLQKLQSEQRLRRIGPAKGGYWEVLE